MSSGQSKVPTALDDNTTIGTEAGFAVPVTHLKVCYQAKASSGYHRHFQQREHKWRISMVRYLSCWASSLHKQKRVCNGLKGTFEGCFSHDRSEEAPASRSKEVMAKMSNRLWAPRTVDRSCRRVRTSDDCVVGYRTFVYNRSPCFTKANVTAASTPDSVGAKRLGAKRHLASLSADWWLLRNRADS